MEGEFWVVRSPEQKANAAAAVSLLNPSIEQPYSVQIKPYSEKRRAAQDRLAHKWYGEISQQGGEYTPIQIKARCKGKWGVPLLLPDDEMFAFLWTECYSKLEHEKLLEALETLIPVTSKFNVKQMSRYLNDMERSLVGKYKLTNPALYGLDEAEK